MTTLILDTDVGEPWITAIHDFEHKLETSKARTRVKAARDLGEVAEGLRIVVRVSLWYRHSCVMQTADRLARQQPNCERFFSFYFNPFGIV
jgi:hypothetical protein